MKNSMVILLILFTTFAFSQQPTNSLLNYKKSIATKKVPYSLNMVPFKMEGFKKSTTSITEALRKSYKQKSNPSDNMPIFEPKGKFYLKIFEVDEDIDHKLRIFDLEKSKYNLRSMG